MNVPWRLLILLWVLMSGCLMTSCGDDDDETDGVDGITDCAEDDPLAVDSADHDEGLNLIEQSVALSGGCFDDTTTALLIDEGGAEQDISAQAESSSLLTVTLPAGLTIGSYTILLARGDRTTDIEWDAVSEIVVGGMYEGAFHVLDVSDKADPQQVIVAQPWPDEVNRWIGHPTVNHEGLRVYFWDEDSPSQGGIYGADLIDGNNVQKITGDLVPYYHTPDASPTEPAVTFLGCAEVANVCSIYWAGEDGTGETMLADVGETVEVNNDTTSSWGLWDPVFSPDGSKIAYLRETVCEGSTEPEGCEYDFYGLVMTMNTDGSGKEVVYWEPGSLVFQWLHWTPSGDLVWGRNDGPTQAFQLYTIGAAAPITIEAPGESWDTEWNIWGEGIVWLAYSPLENAMILQPFDTNYVVHFPVTVTDSTAVGGEGVLLNPPDPDTPGETIGHYIEYDWFGLRP